MTSDIIMGVVIGVLIFLSAFFSSIETAFSFVNKIRIQRYLDDGNKHAKNALYIIEHFDNALTAILICNNIVNLSCSSLATVLCIKLFGDIGSAIATGATTLLVLTFGEVLPKCLAQEHCDSFVLKTSGILKKAICFVPFALVVVGLATSIAGVVYSTRIEKNLTKEYMNTPAYARYVMSEREKIEQQYDNKKLSFYDYRELYSQFDDEEFAKGYLKETNEEFAEGLKRADLYSNIAYGATGVMGVNLAILLYQAWYIDRHGSTRLYNSGADDYIEGKRLYKEGTDFSFPVDRQNFPAIEEEYK